MNSDWPDLASQLKTSLSGGLDVAGTVEEVDILSHVGRVAVDIIIETTDLEGGEQEQAYAVLCDLLATRLAGEADQVLGCLVFATEPDPQALATALVGMSRGDVRDTFTPVIPLSRYQAEAMAEAGLSINSIIDAATDLIAVAADRDQPTAETAATLLAEIDELIDRHLNQ